MQKPVLALVGVAAVAASITFLYLSTRETSDPAAPSSAVADPEDAPVEGAEEIASAPAELAETEAPSAPARTVLPEPEAAPPDERIVGEWASEGEMTWIEGRVDLPAAVPQDETLFVMGLLHELPPSEIYGEGGLLRQIEVEDVSEDHRDGALLAVQPVAADGSFRLPFPAENSAGSIAVSGRYLFSKECTFVDLTSSEPVVVSPDVGAWVRGRVSIPADMADAAETLAGIEVDLEYDPRQFSMFDLGSSYMFTREVGVDENGYFEFRGVDPQPPYRLEIDSDDLANHIESPIELHEARDFPMEASLVHGGRVSGHVFDDTGRPIEDATVRASGALFFGIAAESVRSDKTDEDGYFELEHVTPGEIHVSVNSKGYLEPTKETFQLADRETKGGLVFELGRGNKITGRVLLPDGSAAVGAEVDVGFDMAAMATGAAFNATRGASGDDETDEEGYFEVTGLGKGPFQVEVEFDVEVEEGDEEVAYSARTSGLKPNTLDVVLTLEPAPVLSGLVFDRQGAPVDAFNVVAERNDQVFWAAPEARDESFESEDGSFELDGLTVGEWKFHAYATGFGQSETVTVTLPLTAGTPPFEFVLPEAGIAAGKVLDPEGYPIAGAKVSRKLDLQQTIANASGLVDVDEARSDEEGEFELGDLSPGGHSLIATHPDYAESEAVAFEIEEGGRTDDIVLELRTGGTLSGQVFDNEGEPAQGVTVLIQDTTNFMPVILSTEADGMFVRERLKPGNWQVTAMMGSFDPGSLADGEDGDMSDFLANMRYTIAEVKDGEETHVLLGAPPSDPVKLSGRVTHAGEPIARAMVSFFPDGASGFELMKFTQTDSEGGYSVDLAQPGDYHVQVQVFGISGTEQNNVEFGETVPEEVEEHKLDIELPVGRLSGRVFDPDGEPIQGARVTLGTDGGVAYGTFMGGQYVETTTDEDGRYEVDYVRPGLYSLAVGGAVFGGVFGGGASNGRTVMSGIRVEEGQALDGLDFRLPRPGTIAGRVVDLAGMPLEGASIFVRDETGNLLERFSMITTDGSGQFTYEGVAPGAYTVSARTQELASFESEPVRVVEGQSTDCVLTLDAGTILLVRVTDKSGEDVKARVSVVDSEEREVNGMLSFQDLANAASGEIFSSKEQRVGPLPPGGYAVTAYAEDGRVTSKPVTLTGQSERKIKIRLK